METLVDQWEAVTTSQNFRILVVGDGRAPKVLLDTIKIGASSKIMFEHFALEDALNAVAHDPFDLILLDLAMVKSPLNAFHAVAGTWTAPIVLLNGPDMEGVASRLLEQGALDLWPKDFSRGDLLSKLTLMARTNAHGKLQHRALLKYRLVVEQLKDMVWTMGLDLRFSYVSPGASELLGFEPQHMVGMHISQILDSESFERARGLFRIDLDIGTADRTPKTRVLELLHRHRDGGLFWAEVKVFFKRNEKGFPVGLAGHTRNISKRKQTEERLMESERKFRLLAENATDLITRHNFLGDFLYASPSSLQIIGYPPDTLSGKNIYDFFHSEDIEKTRSDFMKIIREKKGFLLNFRLHHRNGSIVWMEAQCNPMFDELGKVVEIQSTSRDVTARMLIEEDLQLAANALSQTVEGIAILNENGALHSVNRAFSGLTGFSLEEIFGTKLDALFSRTRRSSGMDGLISGLNQVGTWKGECTCYGKAGKEFPCLLSLTRFQDRNGVNYYVAAIRDISDFKRYEQRLDLLTHQDSLTGLPNRFFFYEHLKRSMFRAIHKKENLALLFIDLDRFRDVNDSLGHSVGDTLLKTVGDRLRSCLQPGDLTARFSGDEFVVLLEALDNDRDVGVTVEKILKILNQPVELNGSKLFSSASIGVTCFPTDGADIETLLKNADIALKSAKELGRNGYQFFSPQLNEMAREKMELANHLRLALARQELFLHFQPLMDLQTHKITGFEALVRWRHPILGVVPPSKFIPLAEEIGLIGEIGDWVLKNTCSYAAAWKKEGLPPVKVSINLSAKQFQNGLVESIVETLEHQRLEPQWLQLEITEGLLMDNPEESKRILQRLHNRGIKIAIDDFGTGYSALSYLKHFPVDCLKIDRSFIKELLTNIDDIVIIKTIIAMAKNLNIKIVAEGIETREQAGFLIKEGCDEGQGYYFSKPIPPNTFKELLSVNEPLFGGAV